LHVVKAFREKFGATVIGKDTDKNIYDGNYWFKKHESLLKKLRISLDESSK